MTDLALRRLEGESRFRRGRYWRRAHFSISVAVLVCLGGCSVVDALLCDTEIQKQVPTTQGRFVATVFHRECGATTGFNTQLSIRRKWQSFDHSDAVLVIDGRHDLEIKWSADDKLVVSLPAAKVYAQESTWGPVVVEYRRAPEGQ